MLICQWLRVVFLKLAPSVRLRGAPSLSLLGYGFREVYCRTELKYEFLVKLRKTKSPAIAG